MQTYNCIFNEDTLMNDHIIYSVQQRQDYEAMYKNKKALQKYYEFSKQTTNGKIL